MAVGLDTVVYSLLKKYTDNSIRGITGALAGKNCTIESVSKQDGLTTVTFKWTADDGTVRRTQIEVEDGTPIYTWTSGNHYEYGDLVIYASMFYRCITDNSDTEFDDTKWNELGSPDGNYDIVQNVADLPTRFTAADRKLYYVINDSDFYLWNGQAWVKVMSNSLEELEDVDLDNPAEGDVLTWDETAGGWVNGKGLLQYSTMPTASSDLLGRIVQFVGETTVDFINGSFYKCVAKGTSPETYEWVDTGAYVQVKELDYNDEQAVARAVYDLKCEVVVDETTHDTTVKSNVYKSRDTNYNLVIEPYATYKFVVTSGTWDGGTEFAVADEYPTTSTPINAINVTSEVTSVLDPVTKYRTYTYVAKTDKKYLFVSTFEGGTRKFLSISKVVDRGIYPTMANLHSEDGWANLKDDFNKRVDSYILANGYIINGVSASAEEIHDYLLNKDNYLYRGKAAKSGNFLVDKNGEKFHITGIGSHFLAHEFDYLYTYDALNALRYMGVNCLRLTSYTYFEQYLQYSYTASEEVANEIKEVIDSIIPIATQLGFYIIIDWHDLKGSYNAERTMSFYAQYQDDFFEYFSNKYASYDNVFYEVFNEPFDQSISDVVSRIVAVRTIIRNNNPDAVIISGIPSNTVAPFWEAIEASNVDDIFISRHYYWGDLPNAEQSIANLPIYFWNHYPFFNTEWGNAAASGEEPSNDKCSQEYMDSLTEYYIPHCVWKYFPVTANKGASFCCVLKDNVFGKEYYYKNGGLNSSDLTHNGKFYFDNFRNIHFGKAYDLVLTASLPTPTAFYLGQTYLLTSDQTGYFKGGIYQCVSDGAQSPTYSWQMISGSNEYYGTEEEWNALSRAEQDRYDFVRTHGDEEVINLGKYLEKVTVIPTANADNLNRVVLLVTNQSGYNAGGMYKCVSDGGDPATYSWELIGFNPASLGTAAFKNSTDRVSPNNTGLVESQSVYSAIQTAVSSIYTPRGDITCAELTSDLLIAANVGNIYETSDSGTTTALFLQGAGVPIPTGSNVGIISAGPGRILFNLMANAFDLTGYQKVDLTQAVESETTVEGALGALSTNKVDKVTGKGLSTNDYDNTEKQKVTNAIQKSQTAGLVKNDGTVDTTAYAKQSEMSVTNGTGADADKTTIQLKSGTSATVLKTHQDISGKADKVSSATAGDIATLDANGNLVDSGISKDIIPSNASASNKLTTREQTWIGRGVINTATDLNTVTIPGCYDCPDASLLTNAPSGAGRGKLINFYGGNNTMYFSQMYRNIDDGGTWVRSSAGTWSSWEKLVTDSGTIVRHDLTASANTFASVKTALETFYVSNTATFRTPYCGYITAAGAVWWYEFEKVDGNYGYGELRYYDTDNTWYTFRVGTGVFEYQPVLNAELLSASNTFTPSSDYEILDWSVYQLGNHVWGTFILHNTSGNIPAGQTEVGNFSSTLRNAVNSVCFCSNNRYGGSAFYTGYLFIDQTGKMLMGNPSGTTTGINYAKISIDFCLA